MSSFLNGLISRRLPRWGHRLHVLRLGWVYRALRARYCRGRDEIDTVLHGFPARLNGGNPYPFIIAEHPGFNRPLVDLVRAVAADAGRPLRLIDVGASIGNTVLLLQEQAGAALGAIHCVEADAGFLPLLRHNTSRFAQVTVHEAMLAREPGSVRALVHQHPGTATAAGEGLVPACTLDSLLADAPSGFDVLKVDIDGSDGEALAGSAALLRRDQPVVIFEWHPALARAAGHDPRRAFAVLQAAGYRRLLWFRNTGEFSHFGGPADPEIGTWQDYLLAMQPHGDPHFDVIALPPQREHLAFTLASSGKLPAGAA